MTNEKIRYFSMFTGVGGFELGIGNRADCIGFSEIDKYACKLLGDKFPNVKNYGDATKINPSELPDFDMLCGGFPCQAFSIAGKRRGFQETRGTLFFDIARILEVKRPKLVFLENVKGLLNHNQGKTFSVIIQALEELGYDVQWLVCNSKFFGVAQNRERVFIIGSIRGTPRPEILPFERINRETDGEDKTPRQEINIIDDVGRPNKFKLGDRMKEDGDCFTLNHIEKRGILTKDLEIGIAIQGSQAQRVYTTDIAPTLKGLGGGQGAKTGLYAISNSSAREFKWQEENSPTILGREYKEPKVVRTPFTIRRLTPTECERLQGFPDGWTAGFSDTQRYKMMGNAVTVNVIKTVSNKLLTSTN
jgi:DNA (cytosine-5)-methyltransferase 1